ncbi:MAG: cellulose biosynthesis cyclic di-GMP-binding regulatory protein BcsB [Anaerolineae bacterium]|nr:cellulose biosynthesis cyclic di-GMP-binding regulatory protein BcsB [Anaerolineae bacterium]
MKKNFLSILLVLILSAAIFSRPIASVSAQTSSTPTPPEPILISGDEGIFTFSQLDAREVMLFGPDDAYTLVFGLPANWQLTSGAELNLIMATSFYSYADNITITPETLGGFLTVRLNRILLGVLTLNEAGNIESSLPIPREALESFRADGQMELEISLNSGLSCIVDQQMNVLIQPSSRFSLPHEETQPNTDLANFPRPIYQASIFPDEALMIVPDHPTSAELQSALTVSAGLGNLTNGNLALDMTVASALNAGQLSATHLIFVGRASSLPILSELSSPLTISGGSYPVDAEKPDTGVVQMVNSTWNSAKVVLVVSGNSDTAIVKAAQAVSTGILRSNFAPNLALVDVVEDSLIPSVQPIDQTLANLGFDNVLFEEKGFDSAVFPFYIPHGTIISSDAYFELVYGHSSLLDYDRSGLVALVNGQPIGSVRLDDGSAAIATNRKVITIPRAVLLPGNNVLEIESNLQAIDPCAVPNLRGLWLNIWNDSLLHLPTGESFFNTPNKLDLSAYPAPFTLDAILDSTAFVLQPDNLDSWRGAMQIANYFGEKGNGPFSKLSTFYANDFPEAERANYHILAVGLPSKLPIVGEMNDYLPAPFEAGSDIALENNMQVTFQIPADVPLGYIELLTSPWNSERIIIVTLGNSPQGVAWAVDALVDNNRKGLAGNFAVLDSDRLLTTDTRTTAFFENPVSPPATDTSINGTNIVSSEVEQGSELAKRPNWLLIALLVSGVITLLSLVTVLFIGWVRDQERPSIDRGGIFVVAAKELLLRLRGGPKED